MIVLFFQIFFHDSLVHVRIKLFDTGAGQAKITQFDNALIINENVRWLDVSVDEVGRVQKVQRTKSIVHEDFDMVNTEVEIFGTF